MKIQLTLPKDERFFNCYANLSPALIKVGIIAQVFSAIMEISVIYNVLLIRLIDFTPDHATKIATIGAFIGTAFLELGLRKFTPYSVQSFLHRRSKGLDLVMSVFIIAVTCGFYLASLALSYQGSKEMVKLATPKPILLTTDKEEGDHKEQLTQIRSTFSSDSLLVALSYSKQIAAKIAQYKGLTDKLQTDLKLLERKSQKEGKSYATATATTKGKIATLEATKNSELATLEASQAQELKTLANTRNSKQNASDSLFLANTGKIAATNEKATAKAEQTTANYGSGLAYFSIICHLVFLFCIIIHEVHHKGSGIEQVTIPNQYHFSQSVLDDLSNMINEKWHYYTRTAIKRLADLTPPPPLPTAPPSLYDLTDAKQQRIRFTTAAAPTAQTVILPQAITPTTSTPLTDDAAVYTMATAATNLSLQDNSLSDLQMQMINRLKAFLTFKESKLEQEAKEVELTATKVIKCYLGKDATDENVEALKQELIGFLTGQNDNPFAMHHRRPIKGFLTEQPAAFNWAKWEALRRSSNPPNTPTGQDDKGTSFYEWNMPPVAGMPNDNGITAGQNMTPKNDVTAVSNDAHFEPLRKSYNDTLDTKKAAEKEVIEKIVYVEKSRDKRTCQHCGDQYEHRHAKQKFCNESCRRAAWEGQTGQDLKLKKRKI